jgi:hypothetical protein
MDSMFDSAFFSTAASPPGAGGSAVAGAGQGAAAPTPLAAAAAGAGAGAGLPRTAPRPRASPAAYWLSEDGTPVYDLPAGQEPRKAGTQAAAEPSFVILDDVEYCPYRDSGSGGSGLDCPADVTVVWPPALAEGEAAFVEVGCGAAGWWRLWAAACGASRACCGRSACRRALARGGPAASAGPAGVGGIPPLSGASTSVAALPPAGARGAAAPPGVRLPPPPDEGDRAQG